MINARRIASYFNIFNRLSPFIVTLDRELRVETNPPEPRALLLLDNVNHPDLLQPPQSDMISGKRWLHVLATTRMSGEDLGHDPDRQLLLAVDELPLEDAVRLIESHQPQGCFASPEEHAAAEEIAKLLGGFTLAVEVVALHLAERQGRLTCIALLERLHRQGLGEYEQLAKGVHMEWLRRI